MHKLIYISLITLAGALAAGALSGCETVLTPQPPTGGGSALNLADYFWRDSTYHYSGNQTLVVQASGTINDQNGAGKSTLTFNVSNGAYSLSGFSPSDIFGFDTSLQVVADTAFAGGPQTETIRSIAAINPKFGSSELFAASDTVLYQVNRSNNNTLLRISAMPASGLILAEDVTGNGLYAFQKEGTKVFRTTNGGISWTPYSAAAAITAFASAPDNDHHGDLFWVACGSQLYLFSNTSFNAINAAPLGTITALEADINDGVIAADNTGRIYDFPRTGTSTHYLNIGSAVRGLAADIATSANGAFNFSNGQKIENNNDSAIYATATGFSVFAGRSDGSIDHFSLFDPSSPTILPSPAHNGVPVTQFAYPTLSFPDPNSGLYALVGTQIFYEQDTMTWVPLNQAISAAPPPQPGSLTVLDSNTNWFAGYVLHNIVGGQQHSYAAYWATSSGPQPSVQVNGTTYNNVIIVSLTAKTNGTDATDIPQYNIYFEKGVGPAVIEKIEKGKTVWISLVK